MLPGFLIPSLQTTVTMLIPDSAWLELLSVRSLLFALQILSVCIRLLTRPKASCLLHIALRCCYDWILPSRYMTGFDLQAMTLNSGLACLQTCYGSFAGIQSKLYSGCFRAFGKSHPRLIKRCPKRGKVAARSSPSDLVSPFGKVFAV